jgi:hypothetical protein
VHPAPCDISYVRRATVCAHTIPNLKPEIWTKHSVTPFLHSLYDFIFHNYPQSQSQSDHGCLSLRRLISLPCFASSHASESSQHAAAAVGAAVVGLWSLGRSSGRVVVLSPHATSAASTAGYSTAVRRG